MNECIDCGEPTHGLRCRRDNGRWAALQSARAHAASDARLLAEGLSGDRLAVRLGVSKQRGYAILRNARKRQALVAEHGLGEVPWPFRAE